MIARLERVTYHYPGATAPALDDVHLGVAEGEYLLLAGASASGKSTLLRLFNGLVPQFYGGTLRGGIDVGGHHPARTSTRDMAGVAGIVFQEPEAQSIVDLVEDEIAFGMEQRGVPRPEMVRRLDRLLAELDLEHLRFRRLSTLSGGERQRVAIASVLALEPRILLLDEPTSQLDPDNAASVLDTVDHLRRARGITVLAAEHRLSRLLPAVDGTVLVEGGRARRLTPHELAACYDGAPEVSRLVRSLGCDPVPLSVAEARREHGARFAHARASETPPPPTPGNELLAVQGLDVSFGDVQALSGVELTLRQGEIVALVGANGSGKSTLFRAITGLLTPDAGSISLAGRPAPGRIQERTAIAGLVPQDPAMALSRETVAQELRETLAARKLRRDESGAIAAWGLEHLAGRDPRDLSVGQQQRVAVAAMLTHEPPVWLLDEPTRGADETVRAWLAQRLRAHAASGGAAIVATHDMEAAARFATRVVRLDRGRVAFDLPARAAFGSDGPCATSTAQLVPGAIVPEEVLR